MEDLKERLKRGYPEDVYNNFLKKALDFAIEAHNGQKRASGEDYIIHPTAVATILVDLGLDPPTIAAALLHDVLEDTPVSEEELRAEFGDETCDLVIGVTKLDKIDFVSKEQEQAENFRKMFFAMAKDIRVLMIKLADRLHNMRSLKYLNEQRRLNMANETLDIYAPLAGRLGISQIKCELEDLCLRYLHPESYYYLVDMVNAKVDERQRFVDLVVKDLQGMLSESGIRGEVFGRPKHFYSIYKKMNSKNLTFDQIYDLTAVRVIVETVDECYDILGKIHKRWKPIPGRIKDYIAMPKPNMYQSLHTTVVTNFGQPFEIQIRTFDMHRTAEYGIAAHWKYKEGKANNGVDEMEKRLSWLREVMEWQGDFKDSTEFLSTIKGDLYRGELLVFTPKGDVISLPEGATPIDFAYRIHSAVGNKCIGAKVNGKIVPLNSTLAVGDVVEVITSQNAKGPSWDWLKIAKSSAAKSKIRQFFKREMKEENVKRGKSMLEKEAKRRGFALNDLLNERSLSMLFSKLAFTSEDEMYASIGYGAVTIGQVIIKLIDFYLKEVEKNKPQEFVAATPKRKNNDTGVIIKGNTGLLVRFAGCCSPVPGDKIVGFISRGRGITVHRQDCPNVKGMEPERLIEASWAEDVALDYSVSLQIMAHDSPGLLLKISSIVSNMKLGITALNARIDKQKNAIFNITVTIRRTQELEELIAKLKSEASISDVFRTTT